MEMHSTTHAHTQKLTSTYFGHFLVVPLHPLVEMRSSQELPAVYLESVHPTLQENEKFMDWTPIELAIINQN